MNFWDVISTTARHIHPLMTDFPAAFLPVSVVLNFISQRWTNLRQVAWVTMLIGTGGAIVAFITGDATAEALSAPVQALVQPHQILAISTTVFFVGLTVWQWRAHRNNKKVMGTKLFLILSVVGLILLVITGMYGGSLVYEKGIGVSLP